MECLEYYMKEKVFIHLHITGKQRNHFKYKTENKYSRIQQFGCIINSNTSWVQFYILIFVNYKFDALVIYSSQLTNTNTGTCIYIYIVESIVW